LRFAHTRYRVLATNAGDFKRLAKSVNPNSKWLHSLPSQETRNAGSVILELTHGLRIW